MVSALVVVVDLVAAFHVFGLRLPRFCVDINSPRTLQTATEKLFRAVSEHATDCPIVVIATKKDDFLDLEFSKRRKTLKKEGKRFDEEACDEYAEEQLQERIEIIRKEMESVSGGRLDACLAVSQGKFARPLHRWIKILTMLHADDSNSIAELSKTTSHCFDTDKVRLLYVRAQVTRIGTYTDSRFVFREWCHVPGLSQLP